MPNKIIQLENRIPKLRFPGFFGAWEEKKLGDVGENIIGLTYSPNNVVNDNGIIVLRSSNIKNDVLDLNDLVRVDLDISDKLKIQRNDILICTRNGSQRLIGKNILLNDFNRDMTFGAFMSIYRSHYNRFFSHVFKTSKWRKQVEINLGARINQITTGYLNGFSFFIPKEDEQQKIAEFLEFIDAWIRNLYAQRESFELYKKGITQKIFDGGIRFKDEGGNNFADWKKRKLSEVLLEHKDKSSGNEEVYSVSVHKGLINQIEHLGRSFSAATTDHYNLVKPNDIVYTKSPTGSFPLGIIKQSKIKKNVIVSPLYGVFSPETPGLGYLLNVYFESAINTRNYLSSIVRKGAKNTINITNKIFLSKSLRLPVSMDEQNKIGEFLASIDNLICIRVNSPRLAAVVYNR